MRYIIWGSYYNIPKAIFYLLKGDYRSFYALRTLRTLAEVKSGLQVSSD